MMISTIIPAHNAERTIGWAIESVMDEPTRVIVVDDGSTDHTREVVSGYGVECISIVHSGPSEARNVGTHHALDSEHITHIQYLDADDWLPPGKLALQRDAMTEDFSYCNVKLVYGPRPGLLGAHMQKFDRLDLVKNVLLDFVPQTGAFLFTREVCESVQWTEPNERGTTLKFVRDCIHAGFTHQHIPDVYTIWYPRKEKA